MILMQLTESVLELLHWPPLSHTELMTIIFATTLQIYYNVMIAGFSILAWVICWCRAF